MADSDRWVDSTTDIDEDELNKLIDRSHENMVRNSSFESWTNGFGPTTTANPDAWTFTSGDATIEREALSGAGRLMSGDYCAKINVDSGDTSASYIEQEFTPLMADNLNGRWFSASMKVQAVTATDKVRLYIDDGVTKEYSSYASATLSTLTVKRQLDGSATSLIIGVEFLVGTYAAYIDDAMIVEGQMIPKYVLGPPDQCVISKYFDSNGSLRKLDGSCQIVPFKIISTSGITATSSYSYTYTLPNQCNSILYADARVTSIETTPIYDVKVVIPEADLATDELDIDLYRISGGSFTADEDFTIRGFLIVAGYKSGEVFDIG